jgi:hypothetical protein
MLDMHFIFYILPTLALANQVAARPITAAQALDPRNAQGEAELEAQGEIFAAEFLPQDQMEALTTEEEFAQKLSDALWQTVSQGA